MFKYNGYEEENVEQVDALEEDTLKIEEEIKKKYLHLNQTDSSWISYKEKN